MRKSEIFDNFVKIAEEKGLVTKATSTEEAKKILEKTRRADSLSIEDIAKLYGVKPDAPVEMQYIRNIIENAHKKPFVISPSYDALNGLVENENERQDISLHILHKPNNGLSTQHKYAKKDLLMSLVRTGNDLDNRNQEQLRSLADYCLLQLTSKIMKKEGQLVLIGLAAAALATLYWQQHSNVWSQGFLQDSKALSSEINDLAGSDSNVMLYGHQYNPEFIAQMKDFAGRVEALSNMYTQQVVPILNNIEKPRTAQEVLALAKQPDTHTAVQVHNAFAAAAANMLPYLNTVAEDFADEGYKQRETQDEGVLSKLLDKTQILHGGKGLIKDDFDDVRRLIPAYQEDLGKIIASLQKAEQFKNTLHSALTTAATQASSWSTPVQETPVAKPTAPAASPEEGIASGLEDLEKEFTQ